MSSRTHRLVPFALLAFLLPSTYARGQENVGRLFSMTNEAAGNRIVVFERDAHGALTLGDSVATGGAGTGADLGSQGALKLREGSRWLLAVNPGSDELSALHVTREGLALTDLVPTCGDLPVSVAIRGDLVYVLHAGVPNNVTGFRLTVAGELVRIPRSTRSLSALSTGPAEVEFGPNGAFLVVTEKMTNRVDLFAVGNDGYLSDVLSLPSAGTTPFGFAFDDNDRLIVAEAFGGAPDASAVSSYDVTDPLGLDVISASVPTTETSACWIAVPPNRQWAYSANTGSNSITGFAIGQQGELTRLDADGVTATTGPSPADLSFSRNGQFLYVRNGGDGTVSGFERAVDGSLSSLGAPVGGLPATGSAGLAGY